MKKLMVATTVCIALAACGFEPMYGKHATTGSAHGSSVQAVLAQVDIDNIPNREGQYLRNALIDRFYRDGRPIDARYVLSVSPIVEYKTDLDITKDSDATRAQLQLRTAIALTDTTTEEVVLERSLRAISSYNILTSEFATRVSEQNTRENALDDLARQIELQISLFLRRGE